MEKTLLAFLILFLAFEPMKCYPTSELNYRDKKEKEDVSRNLASLKDDLAILNDEVELAQKIKQFSDLQQFLNDLDTELNEEEYVKEVYDPDKVDKIDEKRMNEKVDKEDDWLDEENQDYNGFLSSRRRLRNIDEESEQQQEEEFPFYKSISKKDLESLIYQADPSLTVHQLSPEPQISFRKFQHGNDANNQNRLTPKKSDFLNHQEHIKYNNKDKKRVSADSSKSENNHQGLSDEVELLKLALNKH